MDQTDFRHISRHFDEQLADLDRDIAAMFSMVETQLQGAVRALRRGDEALAQAIVEGDIAVDQTEIAIDAECARVLALRQPAAKDLRLVLAMIKTVADLERIGDEARKIAALAVDSGATPGVKSIRKGIKHLSRLARSMLRDASVAVSEMDAELALRVLERDDQVDDEYESMTRQCVTRMLEDPRHVRGVLEALWAARSLERVGDHACNICEHVIYTVHGKSVRHGSLDDIAAELGVELEGDSP